MPLLTAVDFFKINFFKKKSFMDIIRVSNVSNPDQGRHFVGPDLGTNRWQRFIFVDKPAGK